MFLCIMKDKVEQTCILFNDDMKKVVTANFLHFFLRLLSGDFMSTPQDLIPKVIPCLKCHINKGLILNRYGATIFEIQYSYVLHHGNLMMHSYTMFSMAI